MYKPTATLDANANGIIVDVVWSAPVPLDRPNVGGWLFDAKQRSLAERLVRAINDGAVYHNARVVRDINGKSYIHAEQTQFFHKRHMEKSLRAVGY